MEIKTSSKLIDYENALYFMENRVAGIISKKEEELIWFLEHQPVITAGTSSNIQDIISPTKIDIIKTNRGGKYTYHGPGQRIIYLMLDLKERAKGIQPDIKLYVYNLEQIIINSLNYINIEAFRIKDKIGIWVNHNNKIAKISAIGIRVRKWVSYHGISINISPNLLNFNSFIPCGISEYGVTSLNEIGIKIDNLEFDEIFMKNFNLIFNN